MHRPSVSAKILAKEEKKKRIKIILTVIRQTGRKIMVVLFTGLHIQIDHVEWGRRAKGGGGGGEGKYF